MAETKTWHQDITLVYLLTSLVCCWTGRSTVAADGFPEFTAQPQSHVISSRTPVTLRCSAKPSDAQIRWLYNGQPLDERRHVDLRLVGSDLVFSPSSPGVNVSSNLGAYRCTATTLMGTIVSQAALLSKPVLSHFQATKDVRLVVPEGGYATLTCEPPESSPTAFVVFQKSNGELVDTSQDSVLQLPSGNVIIQNITKTTGPGQYRCVALNPVTGQNRTSINTISVNVETPRPGLPPTARVISSLRKTIQTALGSDVTLECPSYGSPGANITWSKLGGSLPVGRFTLSVFGNIKIQSIQYEDMGTYRCTSYPGEGGFDQVSLEVFTPPVIQVVRQPGKPVYVGDRVEMVCSYGGLPKPSLKWYHNGRELSSNDEGNLVIAKVSTADSGIYQCMASNILGTEYGVLGFQVDSKPQAVAKPPEKEEAAKEKKEPEKENVKKNARRDRKKNGRRKKISMRDRRKKKKNGIGAQAVAEKPKYTPSVPTVTQLSDRSVMLNWTVPDKGNGLTIKFFKVQFKEMSPERGTWRTNEGNIAYDSRRFEVSDLKPGASYKFRVLAVYEDNDNTNSPNTETFKMKYEPHTRVQAPEVAPIIVEAVPIVHQQNYGIGVKWQYKAESTSPIEGFIIYYKPFGYEVLDMEKRVPGAGISSQVINDLLPDTHYNIRMQSFNLAGTSQFSNQVVAMTKPKGSPSDNSPTVHPELPIPEPERSTEAPIPDRRTSELEQPVILGIVLGALLLALLIMVTMCWWKQRQQKRRNFCNGSEKFSGQHNMAGKPNGGPYLPNGNHLTNNGQGPPDVHGHMKIDVNPLAEYDVQFNGHVENRSKHFCSNGGPMPKCNGEIGSHIGYTADMSYMEHLNPTHPMQRRTLPRTPLTNSHECYSEAGSLGRTFNHEYSEPGDHQLHRPSGIPLYSNKNQGQPINFDHNWSCAYDQPRLVKTSNAPMGRLSPCYTPAGESNFGKNIYHQQSCHMQGMQPPPISPMAAQNFPSGLSGQGPSLSEVQGSGKQRRKKKRVHDERFHQQHAMNTKDQATNTDLSSNEGTFDYATCCKSESSSNAGSDNGDMPCDSSFANNGSLESLNDDSALSTASHGSAPHHVHRGHISL